MDYEVRGLKAGAVDYIVKPFAKEILLARVERHLERYQQRQHKKIHGIIRLCQADQKPVNTNRMEDRNSDRKRNGKQGNCGVYALFLWVREKILQQGSSQNQRIEKRRELKKANGQGIKFDCMS